MLQLTDIDHLVLRVRDLSRMLAFYGGVLGCPIEREIPELGLVQLRAGRALLDLITVTGRLGRAGGDAPTMTGRNVDHFCFGVADFEPERVRAYLAQHGYATSPAERRYGAHGIGASIYVTDPEGNTVELKAGDAAVTASLQL